MTSFSAFVCRMAVVVASMAGALVGSALGAEDEDDYVKPQFREVEVGFPDAPQKEALVAFYVSPTSTNTYFVDAKSLSVGTDGVVRYTLVIEAAGGARNVTFEGIRCDARAVRIYATGRPDGSWVKSRNDAWRQIVDSPMNRQHAELYYNYFCPYGALVASADAARSALRRGGHPDAARGRP